MTNLFTDQSEEEILLPPLAERMRPARIEDFIGQKSLTGDEKILARIIRNKTLFSLILWGPPGTGKTTLAKLIAGQMTARFYQLSAVTSGVKDVREIISQAQMNRKIGKSSILFIDEIHRFNKAQQDALLHAVEEGSVTLIGATTENPSFEVISPLLSRCRVLKLESLKDDELHQILQNALQHDRILRDQSIKLTPEAEDFLISHTGGDARKLLNGLEIAVNIAFCDQDGSKLLDQKIIEEALQQKNLLYDKKADYHYDTISAFIKSVRGSDPDAAMYWMAVMLAGGEDPLFIARRLIILASEDVGNANPSALMLATSAFQAIHQVGLPEGEIILAQAVTYLASSPKSNASYLALHKAKEFLADNPAPVVPLHLRNAPTKLMKSLDYGKEYQYPHDFPGHYTDQNYFPDQSGEPVFYEPTSLGREKGLKEYLEFIRPKRYNISKKEKSNDHDQR